jgi:hypothetical protein
MYEMSPCVNQEGSMVKSYRVNCLAARQKEKQYYHGTFALPLTAKSSKREQDREK